MKIFEIENKWFYKELPWWCKILLIYIRGDLFVLLPVLLILIGVGVFSFRWMCILGGLFIAVRQSGELMYWLLQQFGNKKYRPFDFGFKKLDNNAVYILYQTFSIVGIVAGLAIFILSTS